MKSLFLSMCVLLAAPAFADDAKPVATGAGLPVITAPTFDQPLDETWSIAKGTWVPEKGILTGSEKPEDKHVAVLHHKVGLKTAVIELDFRLSGSPSFLVGCDGKSHVGRVVIKATGVDIAEDSAKPSHVIASLKTPVSQDAWHHLIVSWKADEMTATLDGQTVSAKHDFLATPKSRSWFAVPKTKTEIQKLTIRGEKTDGQ